MRVAPELLPPGWASEGRNLRFTDGKPVTRLGLLKLAWCNKVSGGTVLPWDDFKGFGIFRDPNTLEVYLAIAAEGGVWLAVASNLAEEMDLPDGTVVDQEEMSFVQAHDHLILFRGPTVPELAMPDIQTGFENIVQEGSTDGTQGIPPARRGVFWQNRLWMFLETSEVAASDLGNFTRYVPVLQELEVNRGSGDKPVGILPFGDNEPALVAAKGNSIHVVYNVFGDLSELQQDELTREFGCVSARTMVRVGNELWLLSKQGVMALEQTSDRRIRVKGRLNEAGEWVGVAVSQDIEPLIKRINWRHAESSFAVMWNKRFYLFVPLDDGEVLGPELAPIGQTYPAGSGELNVTVEAGARYRWQQGANDNHMEDPGGDTLLGSGEFEASGTNVVLNGDEGTAVSCSLRRVTKGVCNAVLVYDVFNGGWAGYDQVLDAGGKAVMGFKDAVVYPIMGEDRLMVASPDGWVFSYEETYEDEVEVPHVDVVVSAKPAVGNTIRVNLGTVVTAANAAANSGAGTWGCDTLAHARTNLLLGNSRGYSASAGTQWTAPNTQVTPIENGVRFYGTNGAMPVVTITGSWATVRYHGRQGIRSRFVSRGYRRRDGELGDFEWARVDLATYGPEVTVELLMDGVEEAKATSVAATTRDRTVYFKPYDRAKWDATNEDDDFFTPGREDYSVVLGPEGVDYIKTGANGFKLGLMQEWQKLLHFRAGGRAVRVAIENAEGRLKVMGVGVASTRKGAGGVTQ